MKGLLDNPRYQRRLLCFYPEADAARCTQFVDALREGGIDALGCSDAGTVECLDAATELLSSRNVVVFILFSPARQNAIELARRATEKRLWCVSYARTPRFCENLKPYLYANIPTDGLHETAPEHVLRFSRRFLEQLRLPDLTGTPPATRRLEFLHRSLGWRDSGYQVDWLVTGDYPLDDENLLLDEYFKCSRWHEWFQEFEPALVAWQNANKAEEFVLRGDAALEFEYLLEHRPAHVPDPGIDSADFAAVSATREKRQRWRDTYDLITAWLEATDGDVALVDFEEFDMDQLQAWLKTSIHQPYAGVSDSMAQFADNIFQTMKREAQQRRVKR